MFCCFYCLFLLYLCLIFLMTFTTSGLHSSLLNFTCNSEQSTSGYLNYWWHVHMTDATDWYDVLSSTSDFNIVDFFFISFINGTAKTAHIECLWPEQFLNKISIGRPTGYIGRGFLFLIKSNRRHFLLHMLTLYIILDVTCYSCGYGFYTKFTFDNPG